MLVPLTFRDKNDFPYQRDGAEVLWAEAAGQNCILHFEDGSAEAWGYPLCAFHKKVWEINSFRRLDRFILAKVLRIQKRRWLNALFLNGFVLPLSRKANKRLKMYFKNHIPAE